MRALLLRLLPFIFLGITIVLFIAGILVFSYVLIIGALLGFVMFIMVWLKDKLFPNKTIAKRPRSSSGRVIDQEKDK